MPKIYSPKFAKIAYKSACMADRPEMFGPTRGFSGMADSMEPTMQNVVGPTLVAMAVKFGLGAEIQSPTGLLCTPLCMLPSVCASDISSIY